jgi:hypothetical protein
VAVVISMDGTEHYELLVAQLCELPGVHTVHAATAEAELDAELAPEIDAE